MVIKLTKTRFCELFPEYKRMRRNDPTQFSALFYTWGGEQIGINSDEFMRLYTNADNID